MEPREEKIMGLAFRAVDHPHREKLVAHHVVTAGDLAKTSDADLENWGVPKKAITKFRQIQKNLGLETNIPVQVTARKTLIVMNENSVINYGKFTGQTVGSLLRANKTRSLRWLYYYVSFIDFSDEIKEKISLTHTIDKPGTDKEMHELNNAEVERNVKGLLKLKIKKHVSKTLRIEEEQRRKARAKEFTKGKMAWANQGHGKLKVSDDREHITDRMFEKEIRKAGYNLPKAPKDVPFKIDFRKLYREFLETISDRLVEEKRMFLANVLFKDYVQDNFPSRMEEAKEFLFKDFICPSYYETLEKLDLGYTDLQYVVSSRQPTLRYTIISNPETGEPFYLDNYSLETETTPEGMRLVLFNEDTFKRTPLKDAFAGYSAEDILQRQDGETILVRICDIEESIKKAMEENGIRTEAVTQRPRKSTRGRAPLNFDFKTKNGKVLIRLHSNSTEYLYEDFNKWTEKNPQMIPILLAALKLPVTKLEK